MSKYTKDDVTYESGFPVVVGTSRDVLSKYANSKWADVLEAAKRGDDCLRHGTQGNIDYTLGDFCLRELKHRGSIADGMCSLFEQRF